MEFAILVIVTVALIAFNVAVYAYQIVTDRDKKLKIETVTLPCGKKVEAVRITKENAKKVMKWCHNRIEIVGVSKDNRSYYNGLSASMGHWIVKHNMCYSVAVTDNIHEYYNGVPGTLKNWKELV